MTEILTESFCERCGTRYTFESSAPRQSRVGRVRTFSRGVKNFVLSGRSLLLGGDGRRPGRGGAGGDRPPARRVPQDLQLLPDLPPVHVRRLLERRRGPVPHLRADGRARGARAAAAATAAPGPSPATGHVHDDVQPDLWPEADLSQDRLARALGTEAVADAPWRSRGRGRGPDAARGRCRRRARSTSRSRRLPVKDDVDHALTVDEAWLEAAAALDAEAAEAAAASARSAAEEPTSSSPRRCSPTSRHSWSPRPSSRSRRGDRDGEDDRVRRRRGAGMAASTPRTRPSSRRRPRPPSRTRRPRP